MKDGFWDDDVIDAYTDEQAVEDGLLIPVQFGSITMITRAVFDAIEDAGNFDEQFNGFMDHASEELEHQRNERDDWFYSVLIEGRRYYLVDNGDGFTLMKPEDY